MKTHLIKIGKSLFRIVCALAIILGIPWLLYLLWQPGCSEPLAYRENAVWIGHGWLGDNLWFRRYGKEKQKFRTAEAIENLLKKLSSEQIRCIYPHLCPAHPNGEIALYDDIQTERVLDIAAKYQIEVIPWAGGVLDDSARISDPAWRKRFAASIALLLKKHPRLAGIQVNIEPLPNGNSDFLRLLEEIRPVLEGKKLSVAGYPPPTPWQSSENVHWELNYITEVAKRSDELAVMMYDTAIPWRKFYIFQMRCWMNELYSAVKGTGCRLLPGIPAYEDRGVGYHDPDVENIPSALSGIAASGVQDKISGVALYCEWEMTPEKWKIWKDWLQNQP